MFGWVGAERRPARGGCAGPARQAATVSRAMRGKGCVPAASVWLVVLASLLLLAGLLLDDALPQHPLKPSCRPPAWCKRGRPPQRSVAPQAAASCHQVPDARPARLPPATGSARHHRRMERLRDALERPLPTICTRNILTVLLHQLQELDDHLGGGANQDLLLAALLGIVDGLLRDVKSSRARCERLTSRQRKAMPHSPAHRRER